MIMSGWRIYNSEPILPFHFPIRARHARGQSFRPAPSISTTRMGLRAPCSGILPAMWLLAINGIIYVVAYGILSGHFRRGRFFSGRPGGRCCATPSLPLRFSAAAHRLGAYNAVQKDPLFSAWWPPGVIIGSNPTWRSGSPGQFFQELTWVVRRLSMWRA